MKIKDWVHCMKIITALEEGGMTDNPEVKIKCDIAWDTREISLVQEILDQYPGIYEEALRNIEEKKYWEKKEPFRPYPEGDEIQKIKGQFTLGYVNYQLDMAGLNELDFLSVNRRAIMTHL